MKSFTQYLEDSWDNPSNRELIQRIESQINNLDQDISKFIAIATHSDGPVKHAVQHFVRSFQTLSATFDTAVRKNIANPERGDNQSTTIGQ